MRLEAGPDRPSGRRQAPKAQSGTKLQGIRASQQGPDDSYRPPRGSVKHITF